MCCFYNDYCLWQTLQAVVYEAIQASFTLRTGCSLPSVKIRKRERSNLKCPCVWVVEMDTFLFLERQVYRSIDGSVTAWSAKICRYFVLIESGFSTKWVCICFCALLPIIFFILQCMVSLEPTLILTASQMIVQCYHLRRKCRSHGDLLIFYLLRGLFLVGELPRGIAAPWSTSHLQIWKA